MLTVHPGQGRILLLSVIDVKVKSGNWKSRETGSSQRSEQQSEKFVGMNLHSRSGSNKKVGVVAELSRVSRMAVQLKYLIRDRLEYYLLTDVPGS